MSRSIPINIGFNRGPQVAEFTKSHGIGSMVRGWIAGADRAYSQFSLEAFLLMELSYLSVLVFYLVGWPNGGAKFLMLLIEGSLWCALYWVVLYMTVFDDEDKKLVETFSFKRELRSQSHS